MQKLDELRKLLGESNCPASLRNELKSHSEVVTLIIEAIVDEPGANLERGGVIKSGFSPELDNIRQLSKEAKSYLANLESQEREKSGIKSLKVGYNRVFGYYLNQTLIMFLITISGNRQLPMGNASLHRSLKNMSRAF